MKHGYYVFPIENRPLLDEMKNMLFQWSSDLLNLDRAKVTPESFFDYTSKYVPVEKLNDFRVALLTKLANVKEVIGQKIYELGKTYLHSIVGNELAVQRSPNLSIQLPGDASSLLPLHSDVWSGNSPFEVVFWLPFTDTFATKSMYILPVEKSRAMMSEWAKYKHMNATELYHTIEPDVIRVKAPYGTGVLFSHSILHGNVINQEPTTRWTFNYRYKSLWSPYGSKEMGESFVPLTVMPATRIGLDYVTPTLDGCL